MKEKIPNLLTYSRIAVIPLFVAAFYLGPSWQWAPLGLFLYASITDFFDGYLARKWNVISDIGRVLDPTADKLLVVAALIMLLTSAMMTNPNAFILCALVILSREIFVSGLREALENKRITIHVSKLGKWKTATQMLALIVLLFLHGQYLTSGCGFITPEKATIANGIILESQFDFCFQLGIVGMSLLILAALLTFITGLEYTVKGFRALKKT